MHKFAFILIYLVALSFAASMVPAEPINVVIEKEQPQQLDKDVSCMYTAVSIVPPWLNGRDPPWNPAVQIQDFNDQDDQLLSMAVDVLGRVYVCYETAWNITGTFKYGWGLATTIDNGATWDNRVYYINDTTYNLRYPEIAISDNGKIYVWGTLSHSVATIINSAAAFMRSSATCYNDPDSLWGVSYFGTSTERFYPECITFGNGNQLVAVQYTIDHPAAVPDSVQITFSHDSTAYYRLRFRPTLGSPGKTSIGVNVNGGDTILIHAIEYDSAGADWDVICYWDTMGIYVLRGWYTTNPGYDRYPSVFCSQNYAYIAYQADVGSGNNDIMFNYSTAYGTAWQPSMIDLTNDATDETYPRLYGFSTTIAADYIYGGNSVYFNYSIDNGQNWQAVPEIASDNSSATGDYHSAALLYTPNFMYATWEDTRNVGTDQLEIYSATRTTPVGVEEQKAITEATPKLIVSPNPFNNLVRIGYHLTLGQSVNLAIYDVSGKKIRTLVDGVHNPGRLSAAWDTKDDMGIQVPAGVYFGRITGQNFEATSKLVLIK